MVRSYVLCSVVQSGLLRADWWIFSLVCTGGIGPGNNFPLRGSKMTPWQVTDARNSLTVCVLTQAHGGVVSCATGKEALE